MLFLLLMGTSACTQRTAARPPPALAASFTPSPIVLEPVSRPSTSFPTLTIIQSTPTPLPATSYPTNTRPASTPALLSLSPTPSFPVFFEPAGCQLPLDDYTSVTLNGFKLNARTFSMLEYAALLYGGEIDVAGAAITQGSYNITSTSTSAHSGGGVVDISVTRRNTHTILYSEIEPLVRALRVAGFAAWLWDWDESGAASGNETAADTGIHIHAVAIGDNELTPGALDQLTGPSGYFRGYSGVAQPNGDAQPDRHGGLILCQWMAEAGYTDLRAASQKPIPPPAGDAWMEKLRLAAQAYLADTAQKADQAARSLGYIDGKQESAALMCGPLAAAILRDAGLLPSDYGPGQDLHAYWLADPEIDGRPWTLFPKRDYEVFHFDAPLSSFDFVSWPLRPGDFVYTYARDNGFEHMFIVTEVDKLGRAYTVTNQYQLDHTYRIERLMLYDPENTSAGAIHNEWVDPLLGRTGQDGFDVLRRKGASLPPGSLYAYPVQTGDTLPTIAARFYTTVAGIAAMNRDMDQAHLVIGQTLVIPVNTSEVPTQEGSSAAGLQAQVEAVVHNAPSGRWGVYIENLSTGEIVSVNAELTFHPASTIKLAVSIATFNWLDHHRDIPITTGPSNGDDRSFEQLLEAMLIPSEEQATAVLVHFLDSQPGLRLQELVETWGAGHTIIEPRLSTPADLALMWKRLYRGELLSEASTDRLLEILRAPSAGDELRIGGGLPESVRDGMAHKNGTTFEGGWGVVADSAVVEAGGTAYVIVVLANQVKWVDYDAATNLIAQVSRAVFVQFVR